MTELMATMWTTLDGLAAHWPAVALGEIEADDLGQGKSLLGLDQRPAHLELLDCQQFSSGAVLMKYVAE